MTASRHCASLLYLSIAALSAGRLDAQAGPSAYTSATRYDDAGQVTGTIAPDPDGAEFIRFGAVRNTYDAGGRLTKIEKGELTNWQSEAVAPASWTGFTIYQTVETSYDILDRKLSETVKDAAGLKLSLTQYSYDTAGRLECTTVRMNTAVFASPPSTICTPTTGTDGPDRITRNVYDAAGQLLQVQKAYGVTALQENYATYEYSANGKQTSVTDANGNKASMTYDGHDRQIAWSFPSKANGTLTASCTVSGIAEVSGVTGPTETRSTGDDCEKYAYDRNGNRAKLMKRDGQVIRYSYDALNRVTLKDLPATADVYYGYDLRGLQLYARFGSANGEGVTNGYDGYGALSSSVTNMGGASLSVSYLYDADGNRTRITHPDGVYFGYTYDGLDRMSWVTRNGPDPSIAYYFNQIGSRRLQVRANGAVASFTYDGAFRVHSLTDGVAGSTNEQAVTLEYNAGGQIKSRTATNDRYVWTGDYNISRAYAINGLNQYSGAGQSLFVYDENGNLTSDGSSTYTYDTENRLISISGPKPVNLSYDPLGRLYQVTDSAGLPKTRFLYDGDALIAEYDSFGNMTRRYVHGSAIDEPVLWFEGPTLDLQRYTHRNELGSIVLVTDNAGNALSTNSYDEYGIPSRWNKGRFQYTGQSWLPEVGMYYYRARMYSPTLGRFLQIDPVGYVDQVNLYAYVANDPVNQTDPSGMCPACVGAVVEIGFQLYTGELQNAFSEASNGNFSAIGVSAAKIGIGALSGGASSLLAAKAVGVVAKAYEAASIGKVATTAVRVQTLGAAQATVGAATKAATNVVEGKPIGKDVGTAAAVSATVGTAGSLAGNRAAAAAGAQLGANAGTAAKVVTQGMSGAAKKETTCSVSNNLPC